MTDKDKEIEDLKTEIAGLKIRLARIEQYLINVPSVDDYLDLSSPHRAEIAGGKDDLFDEAVKLVQEHDKASASLLQRRFHIGFNRSARLLEQLEEEGIVGAGEGAEPRKVLKKEE